MRYFIFRDLSSTREASESSVSSRASGGGGEGGGAPPPAPPAAPTAPPMTDMNKRAKATPNLRDVMHRGSSVNDLLSSIKKGKELRKVVCFGIYCFC